MPGPAARSPSSRPRREAYPLFLDLTGRLAVVVGGGRVAERKVRGLLRCGAAIRVVSPRLTPGLTRLARAGTIHHKSRTWRPADLHGAWLVYAATDDRAVNRAVARWSRAVAKTPGCLVNVVDQPEAGNVLIPSVVRSGDLTIAISTGGASPALARQIRRELAREFGPAYRTYLRLLTRLRDRLRREVASGALSSHASRRLLRRVVASDVLALLRHGPRRLALNQIRWLTRNPPP